MTMPYTESRRIVIDAIETAGDSVNRAVYMVMENMRDDHQKDVAALLDALNDFHMTYHSLTQALVMCPIHPCSGVYNIVKGARE